MAKTLVAVVVSIVAALAWWASRSEDPVLPAPADAGERRPPPDPNPTSLPPEPAATARTTGLDGAFLASSLTTPEAAVTAADEDDARAGVVRGRLTVRQQPWIHPAGVEVRLTRSWLDSVVPVESNPEVRTPQRDELRTDTDEHGRFAFRIVPPSSELFFLIGHGTDWQDFQKVAKLPKAGEAIDLGDVWLDQRGEIIGRCTQFGQPAVGVTVRVVDDPLLDGTSGFEEVQAMRADLAEAFRVPGTIGSGLVPSWVVRRDEFLPFPTATTDSTGAFRVRGVRPGNHNLFAIAPALMDAAARSDGVLAAPGQVTDVGTLALREPAGRVELTFVDESKRPWVGARIAQLREPFGFGAFPTTTDREGRAFLPLLPGKRGTLLFAYPGGEPWRQVQWPALPPAALLAGAAPPIVVPRAAPFELRLVGETGRTIAGGTVRTFEQVRAFRTIDRQLPHALQPREIAPGVHAGSLPGQAIAVAHAPGYAPGVAMVQAGQPSFDLVLMALQPVEVRVRDLRDRPVANAAVRVEVHNHPDYLFRGAQWQALANDRLLLGHTDDDGVLTAQLWATRFTFQASHRDYAPTASPAVLPRRGERIELRVLGRAEVHGTLTIETRAAPAGLRVRARQKPPPLHPLHECTYLDERVAVTGDGGTFAFRQLAAGIWELTPETPAIAVDRGTEPASATAWRAQRIQLDEGQALHLTMEIQHDQLAPVQIEGTLTCNGLNVARALVRVRPLGIAHAPPKELRRRSRELTAEHLEMLGLASPAGAPWQRCETDAFGTFRFRELTDGDHELRVDLPENGRLQFVHRRVLRPGSAAVPHRCDVALATGEVLVECSRDARPFGQRMLRLRQLVDGDLEGARLEVLLDRAGQVRLQHVPLGKWTVEPMHGGRCTPGEFEVAAGAVTSATLVVTSR